MKQYFWKHYDAGAGGGGGTEPDFAAQLEVLKQNFDGMIEKKLKSVTDEGEKESLAAKLKDANEMYENTKKSLGDLTELKDKDGKSISIAEALITLKEQFTEAIGAIKHLDARVKNNGRAGGEQKQKSFADVLGKAMEDQTDEFAKLARGEKGVKVSVELDLKAVADFSTGNVTGGTVYGAQYRPGIIANPSRKVHMRDLISVVPAGPGTDSYFMYESGDGEGAPAATAEKKATAATTQATGLKPQFDVDLVEAKVAFETIAGFMLLSRKSLKNIPSLVNFLNLRAPEKLRNAEDQQILYGTGTTPEIKGLLVSGNFTAGSGVGATILAEKLINDLSAFEDTHQRVADSIVMRPADYWSFFKNKSSGSGEYILPPNFAFVNGVLYVSGVPVYRTTALAANDYIVGDFMNGTQIEEQESMMMQFFEQDGTNVRTNQITMRIEQTIALPVYGSNYFLKGSSALA